MKLLLMFVTLCTVFLAAAAGQVRADFLDSAGNVLTVPESMETELFHPGDARRCLASLRRKASPTIIDTADLQLEAASINSYLYVVFPLKQPVKGIERIYWPAESMLDADRVLTMVHEGKVRRIRVIPIRSRMLTSFYWLYNDEDANTRDALKWCETERVVDLFRCRTCAISELIGVQP